MAENGDKTKYGLGALFGLLSGFVAWGIAEVRDAAREAHVAQLQDKDTQRLVEVQSAELESLIEVQRIELIALLNTEMAKVHGRFEKHKERLNSQKETDDTLVAEYLKLLERSHSHDSGRRGPSGQQ